ncbi:hypothetical protein RRF57_011019 [Xylaria bambusicola]|uniref:Carbohydrate kinase PfkB domain-containing protein n=1 Tax=Xylaria bambusicola TaxID=326684 RepID=A0AAN7UT89_9PEZI
MASVVCDPWNLSMHQVMLAHIRIGTRFSYTTSPLRPEPTQLDGSNLLYSRSFHFLALPHDLENQVNTLLSSRAEHGITERPLIVRDTAPMDCDSVNPESHLKASALVDVLSPNHIELDRLFNGKSEKDIEFSQSNIEIQANLFVEASIGPDRKGVIMVLSGHYGAIVPSDGKQPEWLPAYYGKDIEEAVDATGASNAFPGAFAAAFQETKDPEEACLRGAVAASYAIKQRSPHTLIAATSESSELWNGSNVLSLLDELKIRGSAALRALRANSWLALSEVLLIGMIEANESSPENFFDVIENDVHRELTYR